MTNWTARDLDPPLTSLGAGNYTTQIYARADDAAQYPNNVSTQEKVVDRAGHLKVHLAPGGRLAVRSFRLRNIDGVAKKQRRRLRSGKRFRLI
jgi:hypothetical protein